MNTVQSIASDFFHLFFPQVCAGCGASSITGKAPLCVQCISHLPITNFNLYAGNPVEKYFWGRVPVAAAAAWCHFTEDSMIQHLLHQLKYGNHKALGYFLGRMMGDALATVDRFKDVDILLPLPLFAARQKKRGYNQSEILCGGIASALHRPVVTDAVLRLSATATQTHKNRIERWMNMQGKFELVKPAALAGKHILLVDDVITTGATLEACGQEILKAPSAKLSIATLAYTV